MIAITRPTWMATIFLAVGVGLVLVGLWFGAQAALFAVDGATATGVVIAKPTDPKSSIVTVNFTTDDAQQITTNLRVDPVVRDRINVGDAVSVAYVRALPEALNTLADQSGGWSSGFWVVCLLMLGVGTFFASVGGWLLISARRYAKLVRRLLAAGVATTGKVIDNDARELWMRGNLQRKLRYEYTDGAGVKHTGLSDWMPRADALRSKPQTTGVVRFDPQRPDASAWFGGKDIQAT